MTGNGAALALAAVFADAGTQCHGTDQSQHTAHAMHDGRACKVVEHVAECRHHESVGSVVAEPAAAPCPVTLDGVDEQRDARTVDEIHRELGAFSHGTTDDGSRCGTEDGLEDEEALYRQVALIEREVAPVGHADETRALAAEHESEAEEEEQERAEHEVDEVLHQDVGCVLASRETRFTQRKTGLHPENQHGCQQHPYSIE